VVSFAANSRPNRARSWPSNIGVLAASPIRILDLQLKKHGIHQLIVIGLIAHTCVEATVRFAAELGYQVTVVKDATASYSEREMHAALEVNIPNYASAIVTTKEVVDAISSL
jgi:ureidoacrylate peracid hydrolase